MFIGSSTSSLFADMVMEDWKTECINISKNKYNIAPLFYFRYVGDILMCVEKDSIDNIFRVFINSYDENLKFKFELEVENELNFRDVVLIRVND